MLSALRVLVVAGAVAAGAVECEAPDREITFPAAGDVTYSDTFGAARSGGRTHEGQDLMGRKGVVLVAAADGTVTSLRHTSSGLSGNMLRITDADGWEYVYIHLNNDTPGTDDGANVFEQAFADGMRVGQKVKAGEPVGYLGDSGNAEGTGPHLHFEIRNPEGESINAFASLNAASREYLDADEIAQAAPLGFADVIDSPTAGTVRVKGWTLDRVSSAAVPVSVYVDGGPAVTTVVRTARPDVAAAYPGRSGNAGFDISVTGVSPGVHGVCVVLHNSGDGGGSRRAGCNILAIT